MKVCLTSCNIRFDNPADGANSWPHRRELISEVLLAPLPDVIASQEGRFNQLKDLETLLSDYQIIDHHRSWIKERMYPTFFLRKDKFELLGSEDLWLSLTPDIAGSKSFDSAFPRLMTWMKVQLKDTEEKLFIVNTHLDHVKPETRVSQIRVLANEVKRVWDRTSRLIIMGDFNDSPQSEVRNILTDAFPDLVDSWSLFNSVEESSHHTFNGKCENGTRIDWILVDKTAKIESCRMDKSHSEGRFPSDHFPIVCEISL